SDFPLQLVRPLGQCITWDRGQTPVTTRLNTLSRGITRVCPQVGPLLGSDPRRNRMGDTVTFTVSGSPQVVSRAIEEYARSQGSVSAIVVPWENAAVTLSMAVTAVKTDGSAIEHTNLGTIRLKAAGVERPSAAIAPQPPHPPHPPHAH